ncbi:MAG: putative signal transduction protein with EAL and GGDEF domain [Myxococcota bacterium]
MTPIWSLAFCSGLAQILPMIFLGALMSGVGAVMCVGHRYLVRMADQMEYQSLTDALTSLPNRRCFEQDVTRMQAQARRLGRQLVLTMWDIDGLKQVSSTGLPTRSAP